MATTKVTPSRKPGSVRTRDALRKLFETKRAELERLRRDGAKSWDQQWEIVDEILSADPPLWSGHYRSEANFIAKELPGESLRSVRRNVLVAAAFRPEDAETHGVGKLEEIALYLMAQSGASAKLRAIDLDRVRVRVTGGDGMRELRAADVTIEDVRAARRALQRGASKRKANPFERAIRAALTGSAPLRKIAVTAGKDAVRFGEVPLASLQAFGKALAKAKLPKDAE